MYLYFCYDLQWMIDDTQWLRRMISHHSTALTTSHNIYKHTKDPKVKKLAKEIIDTQEREISQMKDMIASVESDEIVTLNLIVHCMTIYRNQTMSVDKIYKKNNYLQDVIHEKTHLVTLLLNKLVIRWLCGDTEPQTYKPHSEV